MEIRQTRPAFLRVLVTLALPPSSVPALFLLCSCVASHSLTPFLQIEFLLVFFTLLLEGWQGDGILFQKLLIKIDFCIGRWKQWMNLHLFSPIFDNRWISVLTNSKEEALTMAFRGEQSTGENSLEDLTKAIIEDVQRLPGNDVCCDCGSSGICCQLEPASYTSFLFL